MNRRVRHMTLAAIACAGIAVLVAGRSHAEGTLREKAALLAEKLGYRERFRDLVRADLAARHEGDPKDIDALVARADLAPLLEFVTRFIEKDIPEAAITELLPYLDTPEGKRHLALSRVQGALLPVEFLLGFPRDPARLEALGEEFQSALLRATAGVPVLRTRANEAAAIATLRTFSACQAQIQFSGKIDCDVDGEGEFATLLELTGAVGVRGRAGTDPGPFGAWSDFSIRRAKVSPAVLSPSMAGVDADGVVEKAGYCFRVYLPDTATPAGFTHERGPADAIGLAGGTGKVSIDLSEQVWCAYAWPAERGKTGSRVFFVNQGSDVMQSPNTTAKWSGAANGPRGRAAFLPGSGITGRFAEEVKGDDGDVWRLAR